MTSQEMMKTEAKPGYWWVNKAALGKAPNWKQEPEPYREKPGTIFGYEEKAFLRRQYETPNAK